MLINDKTPKQIKNGLHYCQTVCLEDCPYYKNGITCRECTTYLSKDALIYVEYLESQLAKQSERIDVLREMIE